MPAWGNILFIVGLICDVHLSVLDGGCRQGAGKVVCLMGGVYAGYRWTIRGLYPPETCSDLDDSGHFVRLRTGAEGACLRDDDLTKS